MGSGSSDLTIPQILLAKTPYAQFQTLDEAKDFCDGEYYEYGWQVYSDQEEKPDHCHGCWDLQRQLDDANDRIAELEEMIADRDSAASERIDP